jgi:hypothetical protein
MLLYKFILGLLFGMTIEWSDQDSAVHRVSRPGARKVVVLTKNDYFLPSPIEIHLNFFKFRKLRKNSAEQRKKQLLIYS